MYPSTNQGKFLQIICPLSVRVIFFSDYICLSVFRSRSISIGENCLVNHGKNTLMNTIGTPARITPLCSYVTGNLLSVHAYTRIFCFFILTPEIL